ncbi:MAG TPA: IS4 family transposase, partial [Anaerolineae bacterium]|nr:IS4 family transposase [Anaerolineae bacterium]
LLERIFNPEKINIWFEQTADKQYTRELLFSSIFELMNGVVFKAFPSILTAYQDKSENIGVSVTSVYNKLNGLEASTSAAFVRDTATEMAEVIEAMGGKRQPWLPGFRVKVLDGNCIEATEHRLEVLRGTKAGALPGKSLNVYDPALGMIVDVIPCEDGHAQERSLLSAILPTVDARDVWIMDRNFCVRDFLSAIADRDAFFICRLHASMPWTAVSDERYVGKTETGKVYEQWVEVTDTDGTVRKYRRIRICLKTPLRDGETELCLLTNLSKSAANAKLIAEMYRKRWTIETAFQELEGHLHSEINTLGYPKAALFGFCIALTAYNILAVVKAISLPSFLANNFLRLDARHKILASLESDP